MHRKAKVLNQFVSIKMVLDYGMPMILHSYKFFIFVCICIMASNLFSQTLQTGIDRINSGFLREAREIFEKILIDEHYSKPDKAIAYKHLGTIAFRMGEDSIPYFEKSEQIFLECLTEASTDEIKNEYGKLLYQRANARLSDCEKELAFGKLNSGLTAFDLLKKYIFPIRQDLTKAKQYYPAEAKADLVLAEAEASLAEGRIWIAAGQESSANRAYQHALELLNKGLEIDNVLPDAKKKMMMRKVAVITEQNFNEYTKKQILLKPICEEMLALASSNTELDNAAIVMTARLAMRLSNTPELFYPSIENSLQKAIESLEQLRQANLSQDFEVAKNYFASRTNVYEALLEYYSLKNNPVGMLNAIESMKNRAMQDFIGSGASIDQSVIDIVQEQLSEKNGMLISYFIGSEYTWIILLDGKEISFRKAEDGIGIAQKIAQVIKGCEGPLGRYSVPVLRKFEAMKNSNELYNLLLKPELDKFKAQHKEVLFIAPHNRLNYYPFYAMVTQYNDDDFEKCSFLGEEGIPFINIPSLRLLAGGKQKPSRSRSIILVRSDFSYPPNTGYSPTTKKYDGIFPNLNGTALEAVFIRDKLNVADSDFFSEKNATEENLFKALSCGNIGVVHAATHGDLNSDHSLESFLLLAESKKEDGKLSVKELLGRYRGKLDCNLFVLSACNTNRGEKNLLPGDDIGALSSGILLAGANNVIATQWPASDVTFPKIMAIFYDKENCQSAPAAAMAEALKQFLNENPDYRDPFFWANIVIQGRN